MVVPFAIVSNGDTFTMRDMLTGKETLDIAMEDFPSADELWQRYKRELSEKNRQ